MELKFQVTLLLNIIFGRRFYGQRLCNSGSIFKNVLK